MITRDADKTICVIYKEFLTRRKSGISKIQASTFSFETLQSLMPNEIKEDLFEYLRELKCADLINPIYLSGDFHLSSNGIIYMEQRFGKTLDKIIDYLSKLVP